MAEGNIAERLIEYDRSTPRLIAVVGDPMVDIWKHGEVVPCQEGTPCVKVERIVQTPGGAANAVRQFAHWCSRAVLVAPWCPKMVNEPSWRGVRHDCGIITAVLPIKTRWIGADGAFLFRADVEARTYGADPGLLRAWRHAALEYLQERKFDAVLLSDYDKGWMDEVFIRLVVDYCQSRGIPCVADCKRAPSVYAGAILKGNADWAFRTKIDSLTDGLVVTYGARTPTVNGRALRGPDNDVPMVNHVGAGDCFAAHLTLALAHGLSLKEAAGVAHSAGRVYVQREHAHPSEPAGVAADMAGTAPQRA